MDGQSSNSPALHAWPHPHIPSSQSPPLDARPLQPAACRRSVTLGPTLLLERAIAAVLAGSLGIRPWRSWDLCPPNCRPPPCLSTSFAFAFASRTLLCVYSPFFRCFGSASTAVPYFLSRAVPCHAWLFSSLGAWPWATGPPPLDVVRPHRRAYVPDPYSAPPTACHQHHPSSHVGGYHQTSASHNPASPEKFEDRDRLAACHCTSITTQPPASPDYGSLQAGLCALHPQKRPCGLPIPGDTVLRHYLAVVARTPPVLAPRRGLQLCSVTESPATMVSGEETESEAVLWRR